MNKVTFGLLIGGLLGVLDGLSALFYPEARPLILGIVVGSTVKGLIAGALIGYFAKKVKSMPLVLIFGLAIGLFLAFLVAAMPHPEFNGRHPYVEIMVPGGIVGLIVGFAAQRFRQSRAAA